MTMSNDRIELMLDRFGQMAMAVEEVDSFQFEFEFLLPRVVVELGQHFVLLHAYSSCCCYCWSSMTIKKLDS